MALLSRKRLILVKTESTYGTDSVPTGTDALLVRNLDITPLSGDVVSRDLIRSYLGNFDQLIAQTSVAINFEVELAGSGTAGTAPKYDAILKACGLAATIVASTSVTYAPVSASFSSATIYFNVDGVLHKLTGCRGSMNMSCAVGAIPTLAFNLTGVYNSPTDTAAPAATYSAQATPLVFREGNTSAFSFFSYSGILQSVDFNLSNDLVYRELVGGTKETLITDRKPAGTVMIEAPTITAKDFFTTALASSTGNLTFLHGTTAGNRVTFLASQVDVINPTYQDQDSIMMLSVPYVAIPTTAGNNEFSLAFT
jgi:Phage tail tube protein